MPGKEQRYRHTQCTRPPSHPNSIQFWKQFFEASANVSLSGYEEAALDGDTTHTDTATSRDTTFDTPSAHDHEQDDITVTGAGYEDQGDGADYEAQGDGVDYEMQGEEDETSIIDSPSNTTGVHSTPRIQTSIAKPRSTRRVDPSPAPSTRPAYRTAYSRDDEISTPVRNPVNFDSSPFDPPSAFQPPTAQRQNPDPILHHRILDRNFRIQATPLTSRKQPKQSRSAAAAAAATQAETPETTTYRTQTRTNLHDSSPMSSPELAAPQLRSDLFSPAKARLTPRTPGVSVLTPRRDMATSTGRALFTGGSTARDATTHTLWESDSDEDDLFSPPKTMQFHVPQSRLLQTPAREASKKIVDDLLATAGADNTDEIEDDDVPEPSPSIVGRQWEDDDTF